MEKAFGVGAKAYHRTEVLPSIVLYMGIPCIITLQSKSSEEATTIPFPGITVFFMDEMSNLETVVDLLSGPPAFPSQAEQKSERKKKNIQQLGFAGSHPPHY